MAPRTACFYGAICGATTWLSTLRWILVDGDGWLATMVWVGLSAIGILHWSIFAACCSWLQKQTLRYILLPVLWALLEEVRNCFLIGCPWYFLAYPLSDWTSGIQVASVLGASGISGLIVFVNLCVANLIRSCLQRRFSHASASVFAALAVMCSLQMYGAWVFSREAPNDAAVRIGVMQTNFVEERTAKWDDAGDMCREWEALAMEAKLLRPDFIVAPESCFPNPAAWADYLKEEDQSVPSAWCLQTSPQGTLRRPSALCADVLRNISALQSIEFILGASVRHNTELGEKGNALLFIEKSGSVHTSYLKHACLPFYEQRCWGVLHDSTDSIQPDESRGLRLRHIRTGSHESKAVFVAPLICYEDSLPSLYESYAEQARLNHARIVFLAAGNEALCRSSRRDHLQLVQWRAVEFGCPVVRAVNSGTSAHVDSYGRICMTLGESGTDISDTGIVGTASVTPTTPSTFYSKYRHHLIFAYCLALLCKAANSLTCFSPKKEIST